MFLYLQIFIFNIHSRQLCFSEKIATAASTLSLFIDLVNETVGDALSDLLIVETILHAKDWDLLDWEKLYDVLPYQMAKVTVEVILQCQRSYKYLFNFL